MSDEELRSLQAQLGEMSAQEKAQSEQIQEELVSLVPASAMAPAMGPSMGPSIGEAMGQEPMMASEMGESMGPSVGSMMGQPQMMGPSMGPSMAPSMGQEQIPIQQVPMSQVSQVSQVPSPQQGGRPLPANTVIYPPTMDDTEMYDSGTGSGPFIAVRTDEEAMAADGLLSGFSRAPRRAPYRNMGGMMPSPMQPAMPRYTPAAPAGATDTIRVTKLE